MKIGKPIELNGKLVSDGKFPLICTPLVGRTRTKILDELNVVLAKQPDILEWRVDFFEDIGNTVEVIALAKNIKQMAGEIPLLFTRRSIREGGEKIALTEEQVIALYLAVCESRTVDFIDFEMSNDSADVCRIREAAKTNGRGLILSFHNFHYTPGLEFLNQRFLEAERLGADVAKIAVMPRDLGDLLTLLTATQQSAQKLKIPLVSMSMGSYGALTRLFGWAFGSAMTFAIGASSSAPGQVPIEDLNMVLEILRKSIKGQ